MPIETDCPGCGRRLRVDEQNAGQRAQCPLCGAVYTVPGAGPMIAAQVAPAAAADSDVPKTGESPTGCFPSGESQTGVSQSDEPRPAEPQSNRAAAPSTEAQSNGPPSAAGAVREAHSAVAAVPDAGQEEADWWMKTPEGKTYGPVTKDDLNGWVAEGRVTADCFLRRGEDAWESADRRYPDLREHAATPGRPPAAGITLVPPNRFPASAAGGSLPRPHAAPHPLTRSLPPGQQPHRGTLILAMSLVGWITPCPVFGVVAWVMGSSDIREIRAGRMDPEGRGMTQAGLIIGLINSLLWIGTAALIFLLVLASAFR